MKSKTTIEDLINMWLKDCHNTTLEEVKRLHPEWEENPEEHRYDFYSTYAVTKEQHDKWYEDVIDRLSKETRHGKKCIRRAFAFDYNNCAPIVKKDEKQK